MEFCSNCKIAEAVKTFDFYTNTKFTGTYPFCQLCADAFEWGASLIEDGDSYNNVADDIEEEDEP